MNSPKPKRFASFLLVLAATVPPVPAVAKRQPDASGATSEPLRDLAACKAIAEDGLRLACYDKAAGTLITAENRAELFVVDRTEVERTRKSLFGLSMPDISLFKQHGTPMPALDHIEDSLSSVNSNAAGQWIFHLQGGGTWEQTDLYDLGNTPRPGDKVEIKRAALGSYKLSVNGRSAVRVRRLN